MCFLLNIELHCILQVQCIYCIHSLYIQLFSRHLIQNHKRKVRGSFESIGVIIWEPWFSAHHVVPVHWVDFEIFHRMDENCWHNRKSQLLYGLSNNPYNSWWAISVKASSVNLLVVIEEVRRKPRIHPLVTMNIHTTFHLYLFSSRCNISVWPTAADQQTSLTITKYTRGWNTFQFLVYQ